MHEQAFEQRDAVSTTALGIASGASAAVPAPFGEFVLPSGEFRFEVGALKRPLRPWINVLANPAFGAQLSEAGGGYTWAVNSRMNQLTAWSNDPVADPPSEWFLLQDRRTLEAWSVAPSAWGDDGATLHACSVFRSCSRNHSEGGSATASFDQAVSWFMRLFSAQV